MRRRIRACALVAYSTLAGLTVSCKDDPASPPTEPIASLVIESPHQDDRAIWVRIGGLDPATLLNGPEGARTFVTEGADGAAQVLVFGEIGDGLLLTWPLANGESIVDLDVTIVEAAGPDALLRTELDGYGVALSAT